MALRSVVSAFPPVFFVEKEKSLKDTRHVPFKSGCFQRELGKL